MMRHKLFFALVGLAFFVWIGWYLYRDLSLANKEQALIEIPEVVVESLNLNRKIGNKQWVVSIDRAEHKDNLVTGDSLDIFVAEHPVGRTLTAWARSGDFHRKSLDMHLSDVHGVLRLPKRIIDWRASQARYLESEDLWHMGPDVYLMDGETSIRAKSAQFQIGGALYFKGGVAVRWVENEE